LIWTPGSAGPVDELVTRLLRIVERFRATHELETADVTVELFDGSTYRLATLSAEPGFGFLTLVPVSERDAPPELLVVPVGALRGFRVSATDPEQPFGFSVGDVDH
jgi:hypothetical protein